MDPDPEHIFVFTEHFQKVQKGEKEKKKKMENRKKKKRKENLFQVI